MCGIAGALALAPGGAADAGRVARMTRRLAHRGPDAEDSWRSPDGRAALGHRRLSVIDLAGGAQPMVGDGGRVALVLNGEIYNYRELRRELERDGAAFRTASDTEVLLRLLEREWDACLPRLVGMFAFAAWDGARGEMLLVRDRVGEKPLFWTEEGGTLLFASAFGALAGTREGGLDVDPESLDRFLTLGYVPAPLTIDRRVRKLPAGTLLRAGAEGVRTERWWRAGDAPEPFEGTYDEAADRLDAMLDEAVRLRLRADVPLGVFLSGGVDSSLVAALAARHAEGRVLTFSIGFDETGYDETEHAAAVARHLGTEHRVFRSRFDLVDLLPAMTEHYGEPFGDPSALPVWHLARETRRHVTVALGGDGGDEGFGGYNWYRTAAKLGRLRRLVPPSVAEAGHRALALAGPRPAAVGRLRRGAGLLAMDEGARFAALRSFVEPAEAGRLYAGELAEARRAGGDGGSGRLAALWREGGGTALRRMRLVDVETYLADCLMPKVDVATMAHGLEARAPLLDPDLLRFALSLPDAWLTGPDGGKRILRDVLYRHLPRSLFERPKQGFSVPLERWFTGTLRERVDALARSERLAATGWLRPEGIAALAREHAAGTRDHAQRLFNLMVLDEWLAAW